MLTQLKKYVLQPYLGVDYVLRRKATTLFYFCLALSTLMPLFMLIYLVWIPHRLPIAAPPMVGAMLIGLICLVIIRLGKFYIAGQTLAMVAFIIICSAQFKKLSGEFFTAYSTFIHLFAIPILVIGLFGRKRYIVPMYAAMVGANVTFFILLRPLVAGEYLTAAQVGLMTSVIALTLITTLLFLLRNIMDSAVTEVEKTNISMGRFVPSEFLSLLKKKNINEVGLGDHTEREMTILFADIRNFTGISETLSPAENFSFINDYLSVMGPIIREHNGFIDKYIGDAILALFFKPEEAAKAAVAMHSMLARFNAQFGEVQRMENTVISDTVNAASRIESLTKKLAAGILISEDSLAQIPSGTLTTRLVDIAPLRGKSKSLQIYEVLDQQSSETRERALGYAESLKTALTHLHEGRLDEAKDAIDACLKVAPDDGVLIHQLKVITKLNLIKNRKAA